MSESGRDPGRDGLPATGAVRRALRADCARCFALCCVVPAFAASTDFAIDKPARHACPNLRTDFRCGIHDHLRQRGFAGCVGYDCFGAGQQVAQVTFGGRDWRAAPDQADQMFDVFPVMRQLHELLWYLNEALALPAAAALRADLAAAFAETGRLTRLGPGELMGLDLAAHRERVNTVLRQASDLVRTSDLVQIGVRPAGQGRARTGRRTEGGPAQAGRAPAGRAPTGRTATGRTATGPALAGADLNGADRIGARWRSADLRGASLRGAYLIGADLRGADLTGADLTGADLRGADLRGADLSGAIFLTQSQVTGAVGDAGTRIPPSLDRPAHWPVAPAGPAVRPPATG